MKASPASRLVLALLLLGSQIGTAAGGFPGQQVISSTTLRDAGVTRISDLLLLADSWHLSTIDGYTWRASVNGLNTFDDQAWTVLLDDQQIDLKTWDVINLNALPVALDVIDSVIIISSPRLHHGVFTDKGLIHIHTRRSGRGPSALGHYFAGNETGDPGPHLYTRYRTPNVDRIGTDESLTIDVSRNNWLARVFLGWQSHTFSDVAQHRRVSSTNPKWPYLNLWSAFSQLGYEHARGRHNLILGYFLGSKHQVFFNPLGREIPVSYLSPHIGLSGSLVSSAGTFSVAYRIQTTRNALEKSPNSLDFDYDWSMQSTHALVQGELLGPWGSAGLGAGLDYHHLDTHSALTRSSLAIGKIFGSLQLQWSERYRQTIGAMLVTSDGQAAAKASFTNQYRVSTRNLVAASIAFSQRLFEEDNSPWYWIRQGYNVLEVNGIDYSIPAELGRSSRFTADLQWTWTVNPKLRADAALCWRRLEDLPLEQPLYQYESSVAAFSSPLMALAELQGEVISLHLGLHHSPSPHLRQQIFYMYQADITGDHNLGDAWAAIPEHKAGYRITYIPVNDLSVWAMLSYRSSSSYAAYQEAGPQLLQLTELISMTYSPTLSSSTVLDLSIKKWFWRHRIAGYLILRNIWNEERRYHPVGASWGLSMLIRLEVRLESLGRSR